MDTLLLSTYSLAKMNPELLSIIREYILWVVSDLDKWASGLYPGIECKEKSPRSTLGVYTLVLLPVE